MSSVPMTWWKNSEQMEQGYLLLSFGNYGEDMDVSWKKFTEKYNADLANGIGNLTSRVVKLGAENGKLKYSGKNTVK